MKLLLKQILILLIITLSKCLGGPATNPDKIDNPSDGVFNRIQNYIIKISEHFMKSSDIMAKRKNSGILPDSFPEEMKKRAEATREDKKLWNPLLNKPTDLYRMCLYPFAKVNYAKWCNNTFLGAKKKLDSCFYSFCEVCCDHLVFIYQNAAEKNLLGSLLELNQEQGIKSIKSVVDTSTIQTCKMECRKNYPIDMPTPKPPVPRDPLLGTEKRPAVSCMDIKQWGPNAAASGVYFLELGAKGTQKVFCDMETDSGGWTLFLNYVHQPGQDVILNENKLPSDLKTNSHMYLQNAGFENRDANELRFICIERFKSTNQMWHFKTNNPDLLNVAFTGDQNSLKPTSLSVGYEDLKPPSSLVNKYIIAVEFSKIKDFDISGNSSKGGFTTTPFASTAYQSFWTIKGNNPSYDSYECGSSHKNTDPTNPDESPAMVFTHHSIWFRGQALPEEEARERYMSNVEK